MVFISARTASILSEKGERKAKKELLQVIYKECIKISKKIKANSKRGFRSLDYSFFYSNVPQEAREEIEKQFKEKGFKVEHNYNFNTLYISW